MTRMIRRGDALVSWRTELTSNQKAVCRERNTTQLTRKRMCFNLAHQRADSVQHHIYRYLQQTLWKQSWSCVCEARLTVLWWSCWQMHCTGSVLSLWPGSRWDLCAVCSAGFACGLWAMGIWCGQPNSGNGQVGKNSAMTDVQNTFIIIRQTASTISRQLLCVINVTWWPYDVSLWSTF